MSGSLIRSAKRAEHPPNTKNEDKQKRKNGAERRTGGIIFRYEHALNVANDERGLAIACRAQEEDVPLGRYVPWRRLHG